MGGKDEGMGGKDEGIGGKDEGVGIDGEDGGRRGARKGTRAKGAPVTEEIFLTRARKICNLIWQFWSGHDNIRIMSLVTEAYRVADEDFGVMEAVSWAEGFTWPEDIHSRDTLRLEVAEGCLTTAVRTTQQEHAASRLSHERVDYWIPPSDEDFNRLHDLVDGMRVLVSDNFSPNQGPPPLRNMYKRASPAVNRLLYEWWQEDLAMIVKTSILTTQTGVHFSPAHWTTKAGKREGRVLFDSSDDSFGSSLNSDEARELLRQRYGDIAHPSVDDFVLMVLAAEDNAPDAVAELTMWKWDLRKAFTLLSFRATDAKLLACELTDGLTLVYHTGLFGWTGTPFAFQVISRALHRALLRKHIRQLIYVDDIGGVCLQRALPQTKEEVRELTEGLLGSRALAEQKWETGRRIDFIGWVIDMDTRRVSLKKRNFLKVLHGFFSVDLDGKWTGRMVERLASWASRYTLVLRHLRPFNDDFYSELRGWANRDAKRQIGPRGKRAVIMWRVVLCAAHFDEERLTRPLESFRPRPADVTIAYDASLKGVGVGIESTSGEILSIF